MRIIAGTWKGRRLVPVRGRRVRPTSDRVREAWMSILQPWFEGARVLDLFAGSGALGLESLSRGAAHCTFVERSRGVVRVLERNVAQLEAGDRAHVIHGDAMGYVDTIDRTFDIVLADPPYDLGFAGDLVSRFASRPFAKVLWVEHRRGETIPAVPGMEQRDYGDTTLTGVFSASEGEEGE